MSESQRRPAGEQGVRVRPPAPRWVKVGAVLLAALAGAVLLLHLTGNSMAGMH